jgi:poly-beta-1,6-N-acetyl-D-glucosamine synthase
MRKGQHEALLHPDCIMHWKLSEILRAAESSRGRPQRFSTSIGARMSKLPIYVLVTPARNEAKLIEQTIRSVVAQTVRPANWVIVSDGSTDGTDDIVLRYAATNSWIELLRMPERKERHFAGKVNAFNAGYAKAKQVPHHVVASLDADIAFEAPYFEYLLDKMAQDERLGLVGTPFQDGPNAIYDYRFVNIEHVSGACQVFRRECFEQIGGYKAIRGGGIDYYAVISARMNGWKTRTFTDKVCVHHREIGTAQHGLVAARLKYGVKDYVFANHALWEISRTLYQMTKRPLLIGGLAMLAGYTWAALRRAERPVSREMAAFIQSEQMHRLGEFFRGKNTAQPARIARIKVRLRL